MSSYLEWNILLAVLALFGNFPYGPPLSPNGIWDSFVSLSVSLTHQQHKVVYTGGNFLCNVCICECVCGNWGLGKKVWQSAAHKRTLKQNRDASAHYTHTINTSELSCVSHWGISGQQYLIYYERRTLLHPGNMRIDAPCMRWCFSKQSISSITSQRVCCVAMLIWLNRILRLCLGLWRCCYNMMSRTMKQDKQSLCMCVCGERHTGQCTSSDPLYK